MGVDVRVRSGGGNGGQLNVSSEGAASVIVHPHPPESDTTLLLPFRQYFTDDGTAAGSNDMRANGSIIAPVDFWVTNENAATKTTYIKTISVRISDNTPALDEFGALPALTNGIEFLHITNDNGEVQIHDAIKTNLDFVQLGLSTPPIGDNITAFRADVSGGGGTDTYLPIIDFQQTFGFQWGLRLRKGSNDRILMRIKDNISSIDTFDAIAYGVQI